MSYFDRIKNAKSNDDLVRIESDIRTDRALDPQAQQDYIGYIADRQMYDFGKLIKM